jgi:hypothetical protein
LRAIPCTVPCQGFHFPTIRASHHPFDFESAISLSRNCFVKKNWDNCRAWGRERSKSRLVWHFGHRNNRKPRHRSKDIKRLQRLLNAQGKIGERKCPTSSARRGMRRWWIASRDHSGGRRDFRADSGNRPGGYGVLPGGSGLQHRASRAPSNCGAIATLLRFLNSATLRGGLLGRMRNAFQRIGGLYVDDR